MKINLKGTLAIDPDGQPTLKLELSRYSLGVQVIPKELLNTIELSNYWGVYVLEGEGICYVGQSRDLQARLNTHKSTNKINFNRCFLFTATENKRRFSDGLDFMEAYVYHILKSKSYNLENKKELNPDNIDLDQASKEDYAEWADQFIAILPILGLNTDTKVYLEIETPASADTDSSGRLALAPIPPSSEASASTTQVDLTPTTQTPAKLRGFTLNGSTFKDETSVGVYRKFLLHMHSTYPDFFEKIDKVEKHGTSRRYISRTVAGLGLGGGRASDYEELVPGWLVGYNASDKDYKRRIVWMLEKYKPELLTSYSLV